MEGATRGPMGRHRFWFHSHPCLHLGASPQLCPAHGGSGWDPCFPPPMDTPQRFLVSVLVLSDAGRASSVSQGQTSATLAPGLGLLPATGAVLAP